MLTKASQGTVFESAGLVRAAVGLEAHFLLLPPKHPKVATGLNHLALLYRATNRRGEAEPLVKRALAIDEKSFGPEHPNVRIVASNLAACRAANG